MCIRVWQPIHLWIDLTNVNPGELYYMIVRIHWTELHSISWISRGSKMFCMKGSRFQTSVYKASWSESIQQRSLRLDEVERCQLHCARQAGAWFNVQNFRYLLCSLQSNWIAGICNLIIAYVSQLQFLSLNLIKIWVGMQAGRLFINQRERYN